MLRILIFEIDHCHGTRAPNRDASESVVTNGASRYSMHQASTRSERHLPAGLGNAGAAAQHEYGVNAERHLAAAAGTAVNSARVSPDPADTNKQSKKFVCSAI